MTMERGDRRVGILPGPAGGRRVQGEAVRGEAGEPPEPPAAPPPCGALAGGPREGVVTLGKEIVRLAPGGSIDIPLGALHRVESVGAENLVVIEVQMGEYVGEDDIERFEDDYGRAAPAPGATAPKMK